MRIFRFLKFTCIILAFFSLRLVESSTFGHKKKHALYLMHTGQARQALSHYQQMAKKDKMHDFELLQNLSLILLHQGAKNQDPLVERLTMLGAGLAASTHSLEILETGLTSADPQTQLTSLHFICSLQDDRANELLLKAMSSEFLLTRLEAAYEMAQRKHAHAVGQIEALMHRLPPMFKPFFPQFFAMMGTSDATIVLKDLLNDMNIAVRIEAIHSVAQFDRDDLLPLIRKRATHNNIAEQEACAFVLGKLKDSSSIPLLKKLKQSPIENVKLAASFSLHLLGDASAKEEIFSSAKNNSLFAIASLGNIPGGEEILVSLLNNTDIQVRVNASVSLLSRRDPRAIKGLKEILLPDEKDLAFQPTPSLGKAFLFWRVIPSASQRTKDPSIDLSLSLSMKEHLLKESLELKENDFFFLVKMIFDHHQKELIPSLINLLENLQTEKAIALLKDYAQMAGAPLIRDYCHLALFRLKEDGPYEKYVMNWTLRQNKQDMIKLRPFLPRNNRLENSQYNLSAEESSRLLIEMYSALAGRQTQKCIEVIVEAMKKGNYKNRYALAGLLLRATE